jgi:hypothetical protein
MMLSVWFTSTNILEEPAPSFFSVEVGYLENGGSRLLKTVYQTKLTYIPDN